MIFLAKKIFISVGILLLLSCSTTDRDATRYVDPFIGTGGEIGVGHGNTFPGAAWPFGMIQLSPDNGGQGWNYCSGYYYPDSFIVGFSYTHLSGTGVGDFADISLMPTTKEIKSEYFIQDDDFIKKFCLDNNLNYYGFLNKDGEKAAFTKNFLLKYRSKFTHDHEKASPGFYYVKLLDDDIDVELTTTEFIGMSRYTFQQKKKPQHVILDLGFNINRDHPVRGMIEIRDSTLAVGYRFSDGWADSQRVFFAMRFSRPIGNFQTFLADTTFGKRAKGKRLKGVFSFDNASSNTLLVKVGLSSADIKGALADLKTADDLQWDFDRMKKAAKEKWNKELRKIDITTKNEAQKKTFYTALYHAYLAPYRFSDVRGNYKGYKNVVKNAQGYAQYTVLSLWDTFRAEDPLLAILQPRIYENIIHSMLAQYRQTGALPYWEIAGSEGGSMIGYHAVSLIADAVLKNIGTYDLRTAYKAMLAASETNREGLDYFRQFHYVPTDKEKKGTVSKTVEYCYDDWCIAQVAKHLGKKDDYKKYMARSEYYRNLYDPEYKLMRGRLSTGEWYEPFHPRFAQYGNPHYVEGNAWHYSFFVPQNIPGLIELMGGEKDFAMMLDSLFTQTTELLGKDTEDVTGQIGQYSQGNEPDHHVAYLFDYIGKGKKTAHWVNQIIDSLYTNAPDGLCGNEDCGQMSAWYVFSAIGFYPVNPVDGRYYFGSPQFERTDIHLDNGKTFTVLAKQVSAENIYIQSARLNGRPLDHPYITFDDIQAGGVLEFEMTGNPK